MPARTLSLTGWLLANVQALTRCPRHLAGNLAAKVAAKTANTSQCERTSRISKGAV
jgi:hypothetical protein